MIPCERFEKETGKRAVEPVWGHGERGYATWDYQLWLESELTRLEAENAKLTATIEGLAAVPVRGYTVDSPTYRYRLDRDILRNLKKLQAEGDEKEREDVAMTDRERELRESLHLWNRLWWWLHTGRWVR